MAFLHRIPPGSSLGVMKGMALTFAPSHLFFTRISFHRTRTRNPGRYKATHITGRSCLSLVTFQELSCHDYECIATLSRSASLLQILSMPDGATTASVRLELGGPRYQCSSHSATRLG